MFWSKASSNWFFIYYLLFLLSFQIFLHLFGDGLIEFNLFTSSITFFLAYLIFIKLNLLVVIIDISNLNVVSLFQFLFESVESIVESGFSPRMWVFEHFFVLVWFDVIRIVKLFQRSEFLINDRTNKTCVISLSWTTKHRLSLILALLTWIRSLLII
jgi:hypothetical protein